MSDEATPTTPAAESTPPATETQPAPTDGNAPGNKAESAAKTFTQAEVDALITARLAREREKAESATKKAQAEAERKAAEETGNWKALYEKQQADLAAAQERARALELSALRRDVAAKVGLTPALAERLHGETADELEADARTLLAALPKPAAPDINGAGGGKPQAGGRTEEARRQYEQWIRRL